MSFLDDINTSILDGLLPTESEKKIPLVTCTVEGLIEEAELAEYCEKVASGELPGAKTSEFDIQKIRARHHQVARLLASGMPEGVVASIANFSPGYISKLKNSPAMVELISHYRGPGQESTVVLTEKLKTLADLATDQLTDRLIANPEDMSPFELAAIAKLGFDRSGLGPSSKVDVTETRTVIDAVELAKLRQSIRSSEAQRITRPQQPALPAPRSDDDNEAAA